MSDDNAKPDTTNFDWIELIRTLSESNEPVQKVTTAWFKELHGRLLALSEENERLKDFAMVVNDLAGNEGFSRTKIHDADTDHPKIESDEVMDTLYRFAHVIIGDCKADHSDWKKDLDAHIAKLKETP